MSTHTRRDFLATVGAAAIAGSLPSTTRAQQSQPLTPATAAMPFDLGIASYTFRAFSLDETIAMAARLNVGKLTLKDFHLPMQASEAEILAARTKITSAGRTLASLGVIYMKNEEEVKHAFHYAAMAGVKVIVGVPDPSLLDIAERYVKETDIALAIHNHGPTDKQYPSPESAYSRIAARDKRMGLCVDIGHAQRLGLDPAAEVERFFDRVLDIHIKDVTSSDAKGGPIEIGRGVIDIPRFLKTMVRLGYAKILHLEYEKDEKDPLPGAAESIGYIRGMLAAL